MTRHFDYCHRTSSTGGMVVTWKIVFFVQWKHVSHTGYVSTANNSYPYHSYIKLIIHNGTTYQTNRFHAVVTTLSCIADSDDCCIGFLKTDTLPVCIIVLFKYDLGQKYYTPQVRPDWDSNL